MIDSAWCGVDERIVGTILLRLRTESMVELKRQGFVDVNVGSTEDFKAKEKMNKPRENEAKSSKKQAGRHGQENQ